ncbi:T-cell surface glycoprotein CD8 alpha chain isoform X3 [Synchiropus splendidus]|uniref:T-cell surface glycoprotein CD8 alpha chain isoform X3 n=1 Tax=Synchiropus splendidus TaxID=270530 RepID=UPI00237DE881|nr:T-cell surface glycoprotein CD8 alpha chain isoform X3 [Synchiropus splendidus]
MAHHFIPLLVILASQICPSVRASQPVVLSPKEGEQVQIQCKPSIGTLVMWFRVLDGSTMEFIGSFSNNGVLKGALPSIFTHTPGKDAITLNSFKSSRDSGLYTCGSLKNNQVNFGQVTSLVGEKIVNRPPPTTVPSKINPPATKARPCTCPTLPKQVETSSRTICEPFILGGLAGGCGLLLLLLIVVIVYCNHTRTRRCPHHYRKRPQMKPPGNK